jgi:hypothetical protein
MLRKALAVLILLTGSSALGQTYHFRVWPTAPGQAVHVQAPAPPSPVTAADGSDPYGFTTWLNQTRLLHGLGLVTIDPELSWWAAHNNTAQRANGIGHYVFGPSRLQCAAVITGPIGDYVGRGWMDSDDHRRALLDPTITRYGLAWDGVYWTLNLSAR